MAKTRTFIALSVSEEIRQGAQAAIASLRQIAPSFRWVSEQTLHYTLHFLGDLSDTEVVDVCQRVQRVAKGYEPFTLTAQGVGAFPTLQRPHTTWIGVGRGSDPLKQLHTAIGDQLAELGFRGENRPYVPHLTIGKINRSGSAAAKLTDALEQFADYRAGEMIVDRVAVFASELHPTGPEYHVLSTVPF